MTGTTEKILHECIGLPGSGKTTLTKAVQRHPQAPPMGSRHLFRDAVVVQPTKAGKLKRQAKLAARYPELSSLFNPSLEITRSSKATLKEVTALVLELCTAREALDRGPPVSLFHEGPSQRILSLSLAHAKPLPEATTRHLVGLVTHALDASLSLVRVRVPPDEAADRIRDRARGWKRASNGNPRAVAELLREHEGVLDTIVEATRDEGVPVLEVDGRDPVDENRDRVLAHIHETRHGASPRSPDRRGRGQPEHVGSRDD